MTTMNAAQLEAEFRRLADDWSNLTRRRKGITLARLEELEGRAMGMAGEEPLIAKIKELRGEIKYSLSSAEAS